MKTIAVTSGKGGVGKTNLSANLGIALTKLGRRVVLFDADIGLANMDVVLGVHAPFTLQNVFSGEKKLEEVVHPGPGGVRFVAGGSGLEALVSMAGPRSEAFLSELAELASTTDFLIFDTAAGIDENVLTFLQAADEVLLVTTPDPAAVTDAYATSKALFRLKPDAKVKVVMNMVDNEAQARAVYGKLREITLQYVGKELLYLGSVRYDAEAVMLIRRRIPFVLADTGAKASKDVIALASALTGQPKPSADGEGFVDRLRGLFGRTLRKSA